MNTRERTLALILGGFIAVVALGAIGYLAVYMPIAGLNTDIANLDKEISDKEAKLLQAQKDVKRAEATIKRSLPAELDVARQEYDAGINRILREARVPVSVYTISPTSVDTRPIPEMGPKKPAYQRIALRVTMKPVDFATLIDVLHRYYRLNLLHQITAFSVKKIEGGAPSRRRDSTVSDKADLDVTFTTEAIILDGAESRRALLPIPVAMGAVGGGAGFRALHTVPEPARGLTPQQIARVLASTDRDYTALLVQDLFHGPPPPPQPKIETKGPTTPPPPQKDDTSPYIRLTGFGSNKDGTGSATIQDLAGRLEYEVEMKREKGKLVPKVEKFYYTKNTRRSFGAETELDISEETSATRRVFKVIGFDSDAIILVELAPGEALAPPAAPAPRPFGAPGGGFPTGGFQPGGGGFDDQFGGFPAPAPAPVKGPTRPKVPASTAVVGGAGYALPQQKVFAWKSGTRLSEITELFGDESRKTIQRVTAPTSDPTSKLAGEAGR